MLVLVRLLYFICLSIYLPTYLSIYLWNYLSGYIANVFTVIAMIDIMLTIVIPTAMKVEPQVPELPLQPLVAECGCAQGRLDPVLVDAAGSPGVG